MNQVKNKWLLLLGLIITSLIATAQIHCTPAANPRREIFNTNFTPFNDIVNISVTRRTKTDVSTGIFIAPNVILTAGHTTANHLLIKQVVLCPSKIGMTNPYGKATYKRQQLKLIIPSPQYNSITKNKDYDYGIIILPDDELFKKTGAQVIRLADFDTAKNTIDSVYIIGYPGDTNLLTNGFFSYRPFIKSTIPANVFVEGLCLRHDMYCQHGDSGAPLLAFCNNHWVIMGIHNTGFYHTNNCNYAVKINPEVLEQISKWLVIASQ